MWPDRRLLDLIGIELPIVQAPMAGASGSAMAIAVSAAGALGSLPCAMLDAAGVRAEIELIRRHTAKPFNLNFFCHRPAPPEPGREAAWKAHLSPYYAELGLDPDTASPTVNRAPFDESTCTLVEEIKPEVLSFHFGLPEPSLLSRAKALGCKVLSSATSMAEARWLEDNGCDAIIAQGFEAGGHRGQFLTETITTQVGTLALVPQLVDAVGVPVVAAGGIADGRGIAAAFALGAAGVQKSGWKPCATWLSRRRHYREYMTVVTTPWGLSSFPGMFIYAFRLPSIARPPWVHSRRDAAAPRLASLTRRQCRRRRLWALDYGDGRAVLGVKHWRPSYPSYWATFCLNQKAAGWQHRRRSSSTA